MSEKEPEYFPIDGLEEGDDAVTPAELADATKSANAERDPEIESIADLLQEPEPAAAAHDIGVPVPGPTPTTSGTSAPPDQTAPVVPLELHAESAGAGGQYPTEKPDDPATIWSPRPGVIGSERQGYRKIKK